MEIVPVFITFDPEIDMVEQVGHYASDMFFMYFASLDDLHISLLHLYVFHPLKY
jgi:cytochrome oxidase Cu insertion factor (SCO1/SenC/PrrC family)